MSVSRSNEYMRSERGPSWFNEFLEIYAKQSPMQSLMDLMHNKTTRTVESVVQEYRDKVGLDLLNTAESDSIISTASVQSFRPLSIRHASQAIPQILKDNPHLLQSIDSFCKHSGGNKSTISILNYIRDKLGKDVITLNDDELKNYIDSRKHFFIDPSKIQETDDEHTMIGLSGIDGGEKYQDDVADYVNHNKNNE